MKHRFLREYFSWSNKYLFCWCEWHLREHFREKMLPIAIYTFKYLYSNLVHLPMYFFLIYPAGEESGWISLKTAPCIWRQTVYFWIKVIICRVQKRILKDRHPGWQGAIFNYCSLNKQFPVERSGKEQGRIGSLRLKIALVGITFLDTVSLSRGLSDLRLTWKK